ncbi:MAG: M67 family metallopeptidase [Gammaproteobacteria bacterium]|nr:M67 family metallopeptidase [Gammaproteobacteria bacterium]
MHTIKLPRQIVNKMLAHAQSKTEQEVCGLISLRNDKQMQLIPISNIATEASHFFEMDPSETIQAMKAIRDEKSELYAIYHSHPCAPATPSKLDVEKVGYPDVLYLIISLNTKGVLELKGYKINNNQVISIDLII